MINDGIVGLTESVQPEISADQHSVYVRKFLYRPPGDAAVPPGQAVQLWFYSAGMSFDIWVTGSPPAILTDERRTGIVPPLSPRRLRPRTSRTIGATIDGWAPDSTVPRTVFRARLPFPQPHLGGGWEMLPPGTDLPPPRPPEDPVVPFEVTLTNPQGVDWVMVNPRASELVDLPFRGGFPVPGEADRVRGLWRVAVRNTAEEARRIAIRVNHLHSIVEHRHADLPLSLVNTLAATVLRKTSLTIAYHDEALVVQTPTHFLGLFGVDTEFALPKLLTDLVEEVPTFNPILARMESRQGLIRRLTARIEQLWQQFQDDGDNDFSDVLRVQRATEDIQREIERVRALPAGRAEFCIVIEGMFSDASIDLAFIGKVAELDNKLPQIAFIFDEHLQFAEVVSTVSIDMSPLLVKAAAAITALTALTAPTVAAIFGPVGAGLVIGAGILLYNAIDNHIDAEGELREALHEKGPLVASYVRGFLERLSAIGAVALGCQLRPAAADDGTDVLRISYYDPAEARPPRPLQDVGQIADVGPLDSTLALRAAAAMTFPAPGGIRRSAGQAKPAVTYSAEHGRARRARHVLRAETPGPPPDDFVIRDPDTLHRLDRHDTIVILMMENRSFDHYFYDLAAELPGRGYEAPPDGFANPPPPGFVEPLRPYRNNTIGIGHTLIFRSRNRDRFLDPSHNFDHTMFQIGGGTAETAGSGQMLGFARDLALKSDSPQVAMGYFGLDSLPTFRVLAEHYAVCTRWFASLPVGTQPNRLSAFQGNVPFLYNLHMDDPSLGFLEDYSLFDLLDSQDIDWLFFEGDIGTIRLYDRFRLNVRNVRPLTELGRTLRNARDTGRLPRLIVIEPEFLFGYDDHPPMDVRDGQGFIRDVVGQFLDYGLLDRVLFAITYDEHGGFFDHVPPPGTQSGDPAWIGQVADLYPEAPQTAPDCMGVRVPSIVMSRFVSPEAKATILDHTSILKTILLHNRHRISTNQFARFGERVMHGAHLAELMDLEEPRTVDHSAIALELGYRPWLPWLPWFDARPSRLLNGLAAGWNPTDPARVLHNIAAPRAKRFVSDVTSGGSR